MENEKYNPIDEPYFRASATDRQKEAEEENGDEDNSNHEKYPNWLLVT